MVATGAKKGYAAVLRFLTRYEGAQLLHAVGYKPAMRLNCNYLGACERRWHQKVAGAAVRWLDEQLMPLDGYEDQSISVEFGSQPGAPVLVTTFDMVSRPSEVRFVTQQWTTLAASIAPAKAQLASAISRLRPDLKPAIEQILETASLSIVPVTLTEEAIFDPAVQGTRPEVIALDPDDYHAQYAGHTLDGHQFFLTVPFEPALGDAPGCEFVALYVFDRGGALVRADIENLGPRATMDHSRKNQIRDEYLASVTPYEKRRLVIKPFEVERFGRQFGLIVREPESDEAWSARFMPGNVMAFFPPWDSGIYDT